MEICNNNLDMNSAGFEIKRALVQRYSIIQGMTLQITWGMKQSGEIMEEIILNKNIHIKAQIKCQNE